MRAASQSLFLGFTIGLLMSPSSLFAGHATRHWSIGPAAAQSTATPEPPKPEFLVRAEKTYAEAQVALRAEEETLERLRDDEEKLRRAALAKAGSWIEPTDWWRKKQAIKQSISLKSDAVRRAKSELMVAQNEAQALVQGHWAKKHSPSWMPSWWPW